MLLLQAFYQAVRVSGIEDIDNTCRPEKKSTSSLLLNCCAGDICTNHETLAIKAGKLTFYFVLQQAGSSSLVENHLHLLLLHC